MRPNVKSGASVKKDIDSDRGLSKVGTLRVTLTVRSYARGMEDVVVTLKSLGLI